MKKRRIIIWFGIAAISLIPFHSHAADKSAAEIITRVQKTVKNLKTLSCNFGQEHFMKEAERTRTIKGTIRIKKPHLLRIEYSAQTIVVDGKTVWWYIPRNRQVTLQAFIEGEDTFPTPYDIFRKYIGDEETVDSALLEGATTLNGRASYILKLNTGSTKDVTVWIDRELNFPVKSVEERENGDQITYVLEEVILNKRIKSDVFKFEVPDGVDVVDMR
ncbi:outer membrane lipoprotein carrier protein LolA [Candidatus Latescibacterota bacterium]